MRTRYGRQIVEATPAAPIEINRKIHPVLSEVIMKALSKAPEERYQSGQELVNDLERCKESTTKAEAKKSAKPAQGLNAPPAAKAAAAPRRKPHATQNRRRGCRTRDSDSLSNCCVAASPQRSAPAKAAAAAAGWESASVVSSRAGEGAESRRLARRHRPRKPPFRSGRARWLMPWNHLPRRHRSGLIHPWRKAAKNAARGPSFSEMTELPPIKEIYTPPPPPPSAEPEFDRSRRRR